MQSNSEGGRTPHLICAAGNNELQLGHTKRLEGIPGLQQLFAKGYFIFRVDLHDFVVCGGKVVSSVDRPAKWGPLATNIQAENVERMILAVKMANFKYNFVYHIIALSIERKKCY